ncbi:MAG: GntR family transcriptional regulator [Firmicutes bacterium HGW-Firmicutes-7]|nr:MAG: GntR family transcriptional regulator [Firmicutes bacterium HGW-Firmicutes-7]
MHITERFAKETARDFALRTLKHNIIILELAPGSLVSENELASEMGLSRTPVREALIELSRAQIVEVYPQKGSVVSKIDYHMVEEARFIRVVLEKAIVELACECALEDDLSLLEKNIKLQEFYIQNPSPDKLLELDNEFHLDLFKMVHKIQTYYLMDSMMVHFDRVRSMSLHTIKDIKIVEDHKAVLEAIKNKNKDQAKQAITKHLSRYIIDKDEIQKEYPDYFK